ncbi:MAG: DNA-3-methyladenine glycosylase 2 family protein [Promicromonosporaceae bacterium]|nr:DNA-3-methyladenine glycosylase 2 family protein [Promicromonosporaceae bacterium]
MDHFVYSDDDAAALAAKDRKLARAMDRIGRIERQVQPDLFAALAESIIAQQISAKAATTVKGRVADLAGGWLTPAALARLTIEEIQQCGMSLRKAGYLKAATDAVVSGALDLEALRLLPDAAVITELSRLPGIGVWTAEMLMIFSMQRPDVFSYGDLAIRRGLMNLYGHREIPRERFEGYRRRYSPYGSIASLYLWHLSGEK